MILFITVLAVFPLGSLILILV